MSSAIQNMLDSVLGDVARATKFEVLFAFTNPNVNITKDTLIAMGKTTSFPGKSHTTIDFKYKGRSIPIRGQVKYTQTWECTFILTEDHKLKNHFENWIEALDEAHNYGNVQDTSDVRATQAVHRTNKRYTTNITVYQKNFQDTDNTAKYELYNAFPTEITAVQANYESRAELSEFTVTFAYSHYESSVIQGPEGNFIDNLIGKAFDASNNIVQGVLGKIGSGIDGLATDIIGGSIQDLNTWSSGLSMDSVQSYSGNTDRNSIPPDSEGSIITKIGGS